MSTIVVNPAGAYPTKGWYLNGSLSMSAQVDVQDNLPEELDEWGERDRFWTRPTKQFSVIGRNFTLAETLAWEALLTKPGDQITVVLADSQSIGPGYLGAFSRTNTEGSSLYDIGLTVDLDAPHPKDTTYPS